MTKEESIPELLRAVGAELDATTTVSTTSLARARAKLAWIASLVPDQRSEARHLLDFAAEVASEIGLVEAEAEFDIQRFRATRRAVGAAEQFLADPDGVSNRRKLSEMRRTLMRTIGRDPDQAQGRQLAAS